MILFSTKCASYWHTLRQSKMRLVCPETCTCLTKIQCMTYLVISVECFLMGYGLLIIVFISCYNKVNLSTFPIFIAPQLINCDCFLHTRCLRDIPISRNASEDELRLGKPLTRSAAVFGSHFIFEATITCQRLQKCALQLQNRYQC